MSRFLSLIFYGLFFYSGQILAQQKEDFVMYAKDSSVEIKQPFTALPIPDSIILAADKLTKLNIRLNEHLNKLNTVSSDQDLTAKQKKDHIHKLEVAFFKSINELLSAKERRKFKHWYNQTFYYPFN